MEKISATYAMEWSIELEKSLRSKTPGRSIEAIIQTGRRIQRWSREPDPPMAAYTMFGLVPGEDKLFANAILLRLADAFKFGDRETKVSIVKLFLLELKDRDKNKKIKQYKGILSKDRVNNQLELVERVKFVFDSGDVESKALALVLFGCWAGFAKDFAQIRYLVLSSMVSCDILEVKASLFAAGCFSELASDFAFVVLEMLHNIVTSSETLLSVRLAGVRVFSKMGCSYATTSKAYKTGLKLVLDFPEEDILVAMLVSLSKLACTSTLILSQQVDLLISFLSQEKTLRLQATALSCLHFIFVRRVCHIPVDMHAIKKLFTTVDASALPSTLQHKALQILHKMMLYQLSNLSHDGMLELVHFFTTFENSTHSPTMSKSILAIYILADLSMKLKGRNKMVYTGESGDFSYTLPNQIISIVLDWLSLLVKSLFDLYEADTRVFQDIKSLLSLLLFLVRGHSNLGVMVLCRARSFIEHVINMLNEAMHTRQGELSFQESVNSRDEKSIDNTLKFVYILHKFSVMCIEHLNEIGAMSSEVLNDEEHLVGCVLRCSFFDCNTHLIYSILLHSHIIWGLISKGKDTSNPVSDQDNSLHKTLVEHENFSLACAQKMLMKRENWPAYRAGIFAVYQGAWVTAAFIFEQLINKVQSESCSCWLKSLAQFSQSESKIQLFLLPKLASELVDYSQTEKLPIMLSRTDFDKIVQGDVTNINKPDLTDLLVGACSGLSSSWKTLESIDASGKLFCFQRWFLALRGKVLGNLVDALKVLECVPHGQANVSNNGHVERSIAAACLNSAQQLTRVSFQFKRLTEEFDLMAMSFMGMDGSSSKTISALALSCSLLALTAGFAVSISNLLSVEMITTWVLERSNDSFEGMITDLVGRLWLVDLETCSNLCLLLEVSKQPKDCFHLQPRNQTFNVGSEVRDILYVCKYSVAGIVRLQNEAKNEQNKEILSQIAMDGLQLLLNTITKWIHIPFRVPKNFFKLRPYIGSELFAFNADARNQDELSVLPGFHLTLNLCLQIRNIPPGFPIQVTKLFCILYASITFRESEPSGETKGQVRLDHHAWDIDNMVQTNEKLLRFVTGCAKTIIKGKRNRDEDGHNDNGVVRTFACFELNDIGQGFSNCLLDVSGFPIGSYRMKWHSCCIDDRGSYWSLLPLNSEPLFHVRKKPSVTE